MEIDDEAMLRLIFWVLAALEVRRESPEYQNDFGDDVPGLIALVDFMQGESKKLIRSAAQL